MQRAVATASWPQSGRSATSAAPATPTSASILPLHRLRPAGCPGRRGYPGPPGLRAMRRLGRPHVRLPGLRRPRHARERPVPWVRAGRRHRGSDCRRSPEVRGQLTQLAAALLAASRPGSALRWLRTSGGARILADLAAGAEPASHALLDQMPPSQELHHLRDRLVITGILPERLEYLDRIPAWTSQLVAHARRRACRRPAGIAATGSAWRRAGPRRCRTGTGPSPSSSPGHSTLDSSCAPWRNSLPGQQPGPGSPH
jgi:hypothetical protein